MTSFSAPPTGVPGKLPAWRTEGLVFNALGASLRRRFGGRIQRISLDAGFTCPNVDGAVARGGCNFCDNRSFSPSRRVRLQRVHEQLSRGIVTVGERYKNVKGFIAYFQPATNTYAPVEQLEEVYRAALSHSDRIVGLAVGTRPDCVPDAVLELLQNLASRYHVSLEFGMQTMHDAGLRWMNRAHDHASQINAIDRARGRGFETCVHVILGVPGEDHAMQMQTAQEVARLGFDAVKIHNLYVVHGTPLADDVKAGRLELMDEGDYVNTVVDFLEQLPPEMIVERVSGEAPADFLVEPKWCLQKSKLRLAIEAEFARRGSHQGARYKNPAIAPEDRPRPTDQTPDSIRQRIENRGRLPVLKL